jgi:hypothetical protein
MALENWIDQARQHWEEFQPTKYLELEKTGRSIVILIAANLRSASDSGRTLSHEVLAYFGLALFDQATPDRIIK